MNSIVNRSVRLMVAFLFVLAIVLLQNQQSFAASSIANGEYTIDYEILKGDPKDDSTSLANGYWNKPATVLIKDNTITVRTVINKDDWVVAFATKQGSSFVDTTVVSRNTEKNTRLVEFKVSSLDEDLVTTMTVDIPSQNYYHSYETRFRFYPDTLKLVKADQVEAKETPAPKVEVKAEENKGATSKPAAKEKAAATAKPSATPTQSANAKSGSDGDSSKSSNDTGKSSVSANSSSSATSSNSDADEKAAVSKESSDSSETASAVPLSTTEPSIKKGADEAVPAAAGADSAEQEITASELEAGEEQAEASEEVISAEVTTDTLNSSSEEAVSTTAATLDEQKDGTLIIITLIIIGLLFVVGSIIWMVRNRKNS